MLWKKKPAGSGSIAIETECFRLFESGKSTLDCAQDLCISIDAATAIHDKWAKQKNKMQSEAFAAFDAGKNIMSVSIQTGEKPEKVEELYRIYLKFQNRQDEIKKELQTGINAVKHFEPPYKVSKMIKNPFTGRGYKIENCPYSFDEIPKSIQAFESFVTANGDGEYRITDANGKYVGKIYAEGNGFTDPSEIEEEGWGANGFSNQGRLRRMMGRNRFGGVTQPGMQMAGDYGAQAQNPYDPYPDPNAPQYPQSPVGDPTMRRDALAIYKQENKRRDLHYEIAEIATRRGDVATATRFLMMAEYGGPADPKAPEHKSFLDELIETGSNEKKLDLLKKIFGTPTAPVEAKEEEDKDIKKMRIYGEMIKDIVPSVKENIIDPVMEGISGESRSVSQLEREAGVGLQPRLPGLRQGGGNLGGNKWKAIQRIGRNTQQQPSHEVDIPMEGQRVGPPPPSRPHEPELPTYIPARKAPTELREKVEISPQALAEENDDDDPEEMNKAEDYGQSITPDDLNEIKTTKVNKTEHVDFGNMSIDEKFMINKGFPRFKLTILNWIESKKQGMIDEEMRNSPETTAREDYHTMTKSSYAMFIGKKRLLKAYKAAQEGYDSIIGSYKHTVEKELEKNRANGMDATAELLRQSGMTKFKQIWEPPEGLNLKAAIKMLLKYLVLKDCWNTFNLPEGKEWFTKYCAEFVKAVEEEHLTGDSRDKIKKMFAKPVKPEVDGGKENVRKVEERSEGAGKPAAVATTAPSAGTTPTAPAGGTPAGGTPAGTAK